jgi:epoxide hydrolase 4
VQHMFRNIATPIGAAQFLVFFGHLLMTNSAPAQPLSVDNLFDRVQEGFADSNGVKIQYVTIGEGPLVLFIHGHPDQWFEWRNQMVTLASSYKVVAMSQRGYNKSDKPKGIQSYDIKFLTDDVAAVLHHFNRPHAIIVGHDWGAIVAWRFAERYPQMVDGLVIFNNPHPRSRARELALNKEQQERSAYIARFTTNTEDPSRPRNPSRVLAWKAGDIEELARQKAGGTSWYEHYVEAYRRSDREAMLNFYRSYYGPPPWTVDESPILKIQSPVLEFHGLDDPVYVNQSLNDTWEWLSKDLTLITLPGVGHNSPYSGPIEYINGMLKAWLELHRFDK